ncbi:MAG: hypothetical protein Q9204_003522 [Flavoplaca sp. TL-2023a]
MTVPRERSPAFQGARLAFSSPPASPVVSQSPSNNTYTGNHGALAAASSAGKHDQRTRANRDSIHGELLDRPRVATSPQQHDNGTPSYIAANHAARKSTERLLTPATSPLLSNHPRPSPLRSYSDLSGTANTDGPSLNALIKRYEGDDNPLPTAGHPQISPGKRQHTLNTRGTRSVSHSVRPAAPKRFQQSQQPFITPRPPLISTESSYTSAAGEPIIKRNGPPVARQSSASLRLPPEPLPEPLKQSDRKISNASVNSTRRFEPLLSNSAIPQLSADALADAMVASSLASSRAPSPTRPPPPPPRRRSRPHLFHRTHSAEEAGSRTPSPSKGHLRQTMRAPIDPNEAETLAVGKQKGNRFINKHPNKHHEGDRKRWRDQITEFERKRYEGVWAANRGLLTSTYQQPPSSSASTASPPIDLANSVLNIVVRDIWSRSNLPADVLEEIWELVDTSGTGLLSKEEFVVGMWLVDQRLKGRKLPAKVSDSVWFSARGLTGVKIRGRH